MKVMTKDLQQGQRAILVSHAEGGAEVFALYPHEAPTVWWVGNHATGEAEPVNSVELSWNVLDECDSIFIEAAPDAVWDVLKPLRSDDHE